MFAMGELAMTAEDLARWDVSLIDRAVLKPASYRKLETETLLTSGVGTQYGLGVGVSSDGGHRVLSHGGEISGFTAQNLVYPDDGCAVAVLTNQDAAGASGAIAHGIAGILFAAADQGQQAALDAARKIFEGLKHGTIDRSLLTENASAYFSAEALKDFAASLGPLGAPEEFEQSGTSLRGGMRLRSYRVKISDTTLRVWTFAMPDGKLEQYQVAIQN